MMRNKFNIFTFSMSSPWHSTKHCKIHVGNRLIPKRNDKGEFEPGVLQCPVCGTSYNGLKNELPSEDTLALKHQKQQTRIISAKKKKKYYDKSGHEITDPDLIQEAMRGNTIISYNEVKSGQDTIVDTRNSRVVRSKK